MNHMTADEPLVIGYESTSPPSFVCCEWRCATLWMVGSMFIFGICATFLFVTASGSARLPTGVAAAVAPCVTHLVLARHGQQGDGRR
jgi:hypothetical protein